MSILKDHDAKEMREMLRAMQNGELTVSRGVELIDTWLAGNYTDEQLPPIREGLGEDEMPWDRIDRLAAELTALRSKADEAIAACASETCAMAQKLAAVTAEGDELKTKHEVACDTIERQRADIDTIRGHLNAMKGSCERLSRERNEYRRLLEQLRNSAAVVWIPPEEGSPQWILLQKIDSVITNCATEDEIERARRLT